MSITAVSKTGKGDEYYTPKYVVEILLPYLRVKDFKTIWCPCDTEDSWFVKVLRESGYDVIPSHISQDKDFLLYEPSKQYDAIITNPPFSIKNKIIQRCLDLGKPFALLLSATVIQSASLVQLLEKAPKLYFLLFDKRISYSGDRPSFPSWYFTSGILEKNEFYIYKQDPRSLLAPTSEAK
jgi:hypothetical protein